MVESSEEDKSCELNLFSALCSKNVDIEALAREWINLCVGKKEDALHAFVQLMFFSAGGDGPPASLAASVNELLSPEVNEVPSAVEQVVESVALELRNKRKKAVPEPPMASRIVKVNVAIFVQRVMQLFPNDLLFDTYVLDKIISFVGAFSTCIVRPFRFAGTYIGLKISTALLNVLMVIEGEARRVAALCAATKVRGSSSAPRCGSSPSSSSSPSSGSRSQNLEERSDTLRVQFNELHDLVHGYLMKKLFRDRFRDVDAEISAACISELGLWMEMCPGDFLKDAYLRHYKLMLAHESPTVRKSCLQSVEILLRHSDFHDQLRTFIDRSKTQLCDMILDQSLDVAVLAVSVLTSAFKVWGADVLVQAEVLVVGSLSRRRRLARVTSQLLLQLLKNEKFPSLRLSLIFDSATQAFPCILPLHLEPLVEVLHSTAGIKGLVATFGSWQKFVAPLLSDQELDQSLERTLVALLAATITQIPAKAKDVSKMTEVLAPVMPTLLGCFREDADAVADLLSIAMKLKPELFTAHEFDAVAADMWEILMSLMDMHGGSHAVLGLCQEVAVQFKLQERQGSWVQLECTLIDEFFNLMRECSELSREVVMASDHIIPNLINVLTKLVVYYERHEVTTIFKWKQMLNCCHKFRNVCPQVSALSMRLCYQSLLWALKMERMSGLANNVKTFYGEVSSFLQHSDNKLCRVAFFVMCKILLLFAERPKEETQEFTLTVTSEIKQALWHFVKQAVVSCDMDNPDDFAETGRILQSYCDLVSCGVIDMKEGAHILRYYTKDAKQFYNIVKKTAENMVMINACTFGGIVMSFLRSGYKSSKNAKTLHQLQEVAVRLADLFVRPQSQKGVLLLFKRGLTLAYTSSPDGGTNLSFVQLLKPFIAVLPVDGVYIVMRLLQHFKLKAQDEKSPKFTPSSEDKSALHQLEDGLSRRVLKSRSSVRVSVDIGAAQREDTSTPTSLRFSENFHSSTPLPTKVMKKPKLELKRVIRPTRAAAKKARIIVDENDEEEDEEQQ